MFEAICKSTNETVNSLSLANNPKYLFPQEEIWFAEPSQIDNWSEVYATHGDIRVIYIREKDYINYNGTEIVSSPHFRIPNAKKLGINYIPESKEHKLAKNWMYNRLINNDLSIYYSEVYKPHQYINAFKISDLAIDKNKICVEAIIKANGNRIIDVILPFIHTHPLLGNGICFEIQFSYQQKRTQENRTLDIGLRGYSACWLHLKDFDALNGLHIELKNNIVQIDPWLSILNNSKKKIVRDLKYSVQSQIRMLKQEQRKFVRDVDLELGELQSYYLNNMHKSFEHFYNEYKIKVTKPTQIKTEVIREVPTTTNKYFIERPECKNCNCSMVVKKAKYGKFYGCPNYPRCKHTAPFDGDIFGQN